MEMYALMYTDTTEEERYLVSINREQNAFETLIKEQGVSSLVLIVNANIAY